MPISVDDVAIKAAVNDTAPEAWGAGNGRYKRFTSPDLKTTKRC